ncbi:hypothetical protein Lste_1375 [Legionella steelei]|uniref:Uncharacterized protein n=1 Tax=Legionella steelei TaxID=947033 RepID=A0A0W0ZGT3_9GAMM|nr:hypothetical protein [Legionella steelei]KTD68217.1 hypothetical protein Lste_1375 [Legionella steelei]
MYNTRIEIDSSSFDNQLCSTINQIDLFYQAFERQYKTQGNGELNFLRSYVAGHSVFRKDILDDSKNILDILRHSPPKNSEELKIFFKRTIYELQSKCEHSNSSESSLLKLIKKISSNLESINSHEFKENTNTSLGK